MNIKLTNSHQVMQNMVNIAVKELTDQECAALYMCAATGGNLKPVMGYEKIKSLCTKGDEPRMHSLNLDAFLAATLQRVESAISGQG